MTKLTAQCCNDIICNCPNWSMKPKQADNLMMCLVTKSDVLLRQAKVTQTREVSWLRVWNKVSWGFRSVETRIWYIWPKLLYAIVLTDIKSQVASATWKIKGEQQLGTASYTVLYALFSVRGKWPQPNATMVVVCPSPLTDYIATIHNDTHSK